ncbi:MAG: hypothetical protein IPH05_02840 [Flavobacteriales bacterium]|jgi:hypothetical protein|nr:hypothetical protein [Flavobacteriales bacterium]MBK6549948.1 hypothetical protein [Flavobacteriales bacterium]MBK6881886.1 hypothetical protein [Flavobacteriales bacterium]MBK7102459.1 hypothetical protein [Flavobacteriales bacterium]MBK7113199.1 hypothetical protein [Flavobacteriales bacterium]
MALLLIREDDLVRVEVDEERSLISTTWLGYVPSPDYRAILLQVLNEVMQRKLRLWISDSTRMGVILHSDEKWSVDTLTPMLVKGGMRRVAIVRSLDFFSQTAAERMADSTAGQVPYKVEFFPDVAKAQEWLSKELEVLA